jgi:hypothetical protein
MRLMQPFQVKGTKELFQFLEGAGNGNDVTVLVFILSVMETM